METNWWVNILMQFQEFRLNKSQIKGVFMTADTTNFKLSCEMNNTQHSAVNIAAMAKIPPPFMLRVTCPV
jgi:hypothetical protein